MLQARVKPLQLIHYTGSDKLAEVMDICPKLRYNWHILRVCITEKLSFHVLKGLYHEYLDNLSGWKINTVGLKGTLPIVCCICPKLRYWHILKGLHHGKLRT